MFQNKMEVQHPSITVWLSTNGIASQCLMNCGYTLCEADFCERMAFSQNHKSHHHYSFSIDPSAFLSENYHSDFEERSLENHLPMTI